MAYTNSSLVDMTLISPNRNSPRDHPIDTITIHCYVGQVDLERSLNGGFQKYHPTQGSSCNYTIATDGRVGLCVEEQDRSWCSGNIPNDHRAITIECACDNFHPFAVNEAVYNKLILLCADICKRNGIEKLVWSTDKNQRINHLDGCNMTVHRDYENKACPGDYLYARMGDIAERVNRMISGYVDIIGFVGKADEELIEGWVSDNELGQHSVHIYVDDTCIACPLANEYREDVKLAGYGNGEYGFTVFNPDLSAFDVGEHRLRVFAITKDNTNPCIYDGTITKTQKVVPIEEPISEEDEAIQLLRKAVQIGQILLDKLEAEK